MINASRTSRIWAALAVFTLALVPTPLRAHAVNEDDWLGWLNYYRAIGSLPTVTHDLSFDAGPQEHARYLIELDQTGKCPAYPHCEAIPPGTALGDEGARNVLTRSSDPNATPRYAVESLIAAPFHALAMLRPGLQRVGFGIFHNASASPYQTAGVINISSDPTPTDWSQAHIWPADGASVPLVAYSGNETPDPLVASSCQDLTFASVNGEKSAGLPILLSGLATDNLSAKLTDVTTGKQLKSCVATQYDYPADSAASAILEQRRAAMVIPEVALEVGHSYHLEVSGGASLSATFSTITPPAAPPADGPATTIPGATTGHPVQTPVDLAKPTLHTVQLWTLVLALAGILIGIGAVWMTRSSRFEEDRGRGVAVVGVSLIWIAAVFTPWGSARVGTTRNSWRGIDIPIIGWFAIAIAVATATVATYLAALNRQPNRTIKAMLCSVAALSFLSIFAVEVSGSLLPTWIIPVTFRRAALEVSAGTGLWVAGLAAIAGVAVVFSSGNWMSASGTHFRFGPPTKRSLAIVGVFIGVFGLLAGRYLPWVQATVAGSEVTVSGWAVPYFGPWSLAMMFVLLASLSLVQTRHGAAGLVLTGCALTILVVPAALIASTAGLVMKSDVVRKAFAEATSRFSDVRPDVSLGYGPWVMYASGLLVAASLCAWCLDDRRV